MGNLTAAHYVYLFITIWLFVRLIKQKEIVFLSIVGILSVALIYTKNLISSVQVLCRAIIAGFEDLLPIFIGISLILALGGAIKSSGAMSAVFTGNSYLGIGPRRAFLLTGVVMMLVSFVLWPSPAVALIAAFVIPLSAKMKLNPLYIASAMNIFGHGIALSGDFFIQGVPTVVAEGAGFKTGDILPYLVPLWAIMGVTTVFTAMILMKKDRHIVPVMPVQNEPKQESRVSPFKGKLILILISVCFAADVAAMLVWDVSGDDATFFIAGTALLLTGVVSFITFDKKEAEEKITDFITSGFASAMEIFAPALVIIGFFSIGNQGFSEYILGEGAPGMIGDFVNVFVDNVKLPEFLLAFFQTVVGVIYSIDGSGFAGLTVIGEITRGYSLSEEKVKLLISLGQIVIIWVGGGTLIPWSVVPVASACGVAPRELVKKNLIPVICGLAAVTVAASIWLVIL